MSGYTYRYSYRGYFWTAAIQPSRLAALALRHGRFETNVLADFVELRSASVADQALEAWRTAHKCRQRAALADYASVDGAPWEIHEIEDEDAYYTALTAFMSERAALG